VAENRRARHEYHVLDTLQVGIVLTGTEIKSIRAGKVSIVDAFAKIENMEVNLYGMNIALYDKASHFNHAPERTRKLLLKREEIRKLLNKIKQNGYTLVPVKVYFSRCWVKLELALCKGKQLHDKRASLTQKDTKREIDRAMKRM
jgi:SsrA-binding protein